MKMSVEHWRGDTGRGKWEYWEENLPQGDLDHHDDHSDGLLCSARPKVIIMLFRK
jgi:hypothetical protein